jgi:hypothetical protein
MSANLFARQIDSLEKMATGRVVAVVSFSRTDCLLSCAAGRWRRRRLVASTIR